MKRNAVLWIAALLAVAMATIVGVRIQRWSVGAIRIKGAVIRRDVDARRELPIAGVDVTVSDGMRSATTQSEVSGYFNIPFQGSVWPGQSMTLSFRHPAYRPLDLKLQGGLRRAAGKLYIAAMEPVSLSVDSISNRAPLLVSNVRIRYTINTQRKVNIGSAVKTFQVVNVGNLTCEPVSPCSPDGKWKATVGSEVMDAGVDNEFSNVRASCIAGPCPFTRIDSTGFVNGGRKISISALDWSDTTTFLLEAEVFHTTNVSEVRESYPVVFGRTLNFTLPPTQEGVSIEADIGGEAMVFPLGPNLYLSWATCAARTNSDPEKTTVYRCELKSGYRF
ncbi:MAG: hypothetical protein ABSF70_08535 [Terracidiphilus sp.]